MIVLIEIKGGLVHEAPVIAGSRESQIKVALHLRAKRLFPYFKAINSRS